MRGERDEILRLLLVQCRRLDDAQLDGGRNDATLEIVGPEREAVAEELDDVVVPGGVVRVGRWERFRHDPIVVNVLLATSWQRLVLWLPALIIGVGLVGAVFILLGRAFAATVRESGHPRWIIGGLVALAGAIALLTYLGVNLPREGG